MKSQLRRRCVEQTYQPDTSNYGLKNNFAVLRVLYGPYRMFKTDKLSNINVCCFSFSRRPLKADFYDVIAARRRYRPSWYYQPYLHCDRLRVLFKAFHRTELGKFCDLGGVIKSRKFCDDRLNRSGFTGSRILGPRTFVCNGPSYIFIRSGWRDKGS